jgi:type II secretory pathway component PulF
MISINLITFLVLFVLPSTFDIFLTLSNPNEGNKILLLIIQFAIGIEWGIILLFIISYYTLNNKKVSNLYIKLYSKNKKNIFVYILSYLFLFDFISLLKLDITFERVLNILKIIDYPMYLQVSSHILSNLNEGYSLKSSFIYLDPMFEKIISIDDFERKAIERIEDYLFILKKQIEINIKKYAMYFASFVYIQIGIIVFVVYTVLMYPLKLLEGMNL